MASICSILFYSPVPPDVIELQALDNSQVPHLVRTSQPEVFVTESQPLKLRCVVNGSNPEPTVTMEAGRRTLTKKDGVFESEVEKYEFYPEPYYTPGLFKVLGICFFYQNNKEKFLLWDHFKTEPKIDSVLTTGF